MSLRKAIGENLREVFGIPLLVSGTQRQGPSLADVAVWAVYRRGIPLNL